MKYKILSSLRSRVDTHKKQVDEELKTFKGIFDRGHSWGKAISQHITPTMASKADQSQIKKTKQNKQNSA